MENCFLIQIFFSSLLFFAGESLSSILANSQTQDNNNVMDSSIASDDENLSNGPEETNPGVSVIGYYRPFWIPDHDAPICMLCDVKFSMFKRRHHCRGCGKVLCGECCSSRVPIPYLDFKEARVCYLCLPFLSDDNDLYLQRPEYDHFRREVSDGSYVSNHHIRTSYSDHFLSQDLRTELSHSSSSNLHQSASVASIATSTGSASAPVSVLKRSSLSRQRSEPKQVIFSDGIRPGNDMEEDKTENIAQNQRNSKMKSPSNCLDASSGSSSKNHHLNHLYRTIIRDSECTLPPIIHNRILRHNPTAENLLRVLADEDLPSVTFYLNKNLNALVKLVRLDCCVNVECWTFVSQYLAPRGQDEIVIILQRLPNELCPPIDIFRLFVHIYESVSRGTPFTELSHILYPDGILGNKEPAGFLFIRPTFQCLKKLLLPSAPYLVGISILKCEIPWVKVFPLRLVLSLGAEYKCYPAPLYCSRSRKPIFFEIGHTIINILADFRNFQYSLPMIPGLTIHKEQSSKQTMVIFPRNRYDKVMKAISISNEHVLSFGGNFNMEADSHLTCIQNDDGQYHTQTITIGTDASPSITGASFIVFIGSLKPSTGLKAKISIVEDGLLIQMPANSLQDLKASLKERNDIHIECGRKDAEKADETVHLVWGKNDKSFNIGVRSCIDGRSLEGIPSIRLYRGNDYENEKYAIRWTELFLIEMPGHLTPDLSSRLSSGFDCLSSLRAKSGYDTGRTTEMIAQSFCLALLPHLESLMERKKSKIGLRVTLGAEGGYDVGSNGEPLPPGFTNILDEALISTIMSNSASDLSVSIVMELIFYILVI